MGQVTISPSGSTSHGGLCLKQNAVLRGWGFPYIDLTYCLLLTLMGSITRCSDSTRAGWSQGDCMGEARRNRRSFSVKVWSGRIEEIELEFRGSIFISFIDRNLVTASMVSAAFVHWGQSECSEHLGFHPVTWRLAAAVPVGWLVGVEVCWLRSLARLMFACFHKNVHIAEVPTSHRWSVCHGHDASLCHFFLYGIVTWNEPATVARVKQSQFETEIKPQIAVQSPLILGNSLWDSTLLPFQVLLENEADPEAVGPLWKNNIFLGRFFMMSGDVTLHIICSDMKFPSFFSINLGLLWRAGQDMLRHVRWHPWMCFRPKVDDHGKTALRYAAWSLHLDVNCWLFSLWGCLACTDIFSIQQGSRKRRIYEHTIRHQCHKI